MPELPEVETVRRALLPFVSDRVIVDVNVINSKCIETGMVDFEKRLVGRKINTVERRGKFLIFSMDDDSHLVIHLRMEGKIFKYESESCPVKHDAVIFKFENGSEIHFNDVRKFGRVWLYGSHEPIACIEKLGVEANQMTVDDVIKAFSPFDKPVKEVLLNQTKIAGIGNIYADEICYRVGLNPFEPFDFSKDSRKAKELAESAKKVLNTSIENKGTTIRSFESEAGVTGHNQSNLYVYGRCGQKCFRCGGKILKRNLEGRGTSYCPKCQNVSMVIGITGGMASGKTTFSKYLSEEIKARTLDCDVLCKDMYEEKDIKKILVQKFPQIFDSDETIIKAKLSQLLAEDKKFRRKYLSFLYPILKEKINKILNNNPKTSFIIEAATLFEAKLENFCDVIVLMKTSKFEYHLQCRGDDTLERHKLAATNTSDLHEKECQFSVLSDGTLEDLRLEAVKLKDSIARS